jgi:hypothetical protein
LTFGFVKEHMICFLLLLMFGRLTMPKHIVIGLFEGTWIIGQALARNLIQLLNQQNFAYVKYEGSNLNIMTIIQKSIMNCEILGLKALDLAMCFFKHVNILQI